MYVVANQINLFEQVLNNEKIVLIPQNGRKHENKFTECMLRLLLNQNYENSIELMI